MIRGAQQEGVGRGVIRRLSNRNKNAPLIDNATSFGRGNKKTEAATALLNSKGCVSTQVFLIIVAARRETG